MAILIMSLACEAWQHQRLLAGTKKSIFRWSSRIHWTLRFSFEHCEWANLRLASHHVLVCTWWMHVYIHITLHTFCKKTDKWNQFIYSKINKLYRTNDIQSFHNENRIAKKNVYIAPISMANHKMKQEKKII